MSVIRIAIAAMALAGCGTPAPYACTSSSQCVIGSTMGVCVEGACALPDSECEDGYRFVDNASGGLAGTCAMVVDAGPGDGGTCGAIDQACCAGEPACVGGASCSSGTCTSCVTDVAFGRRFSCVVDRDGAVSCAGENNRGQLGIGAAGVGSTTRQRVRDSSTAEIMDGVAVGAGREHACAIRTGGTVWCWGGGGSGQIGNGASAGTVTAANQVVKAGNVPLTEIVEVSGGSAHTCARDAAGGLWCWGANGEHQLGDGTTTGRNVAAPVRDGVAVAPFTGAVELVVGRQHACARKANGEVWCWGSNVYSELGDAATILHPVPVLLGTGDSVAAGNMFTCFVKADTSITCTGSATHGRLGTSEQGGFTDDTPHLPESVLAAGGGMFLGAAKVAAGGTACAILADTSVSCWGDSFYGQTGNAGSLVPAPVVFLDGTPLTGVDRLVTHWAHACAHRTDGDWVCWGRNLSGELGDGTLHNRGTPMPLKASCP